MVVSVEHEKQWLSVLSCDWKQFGMHLIFHYMKYVILMLQETQFLKVIDTCKLSLIQESNQWSSF